MKVLMKQDKLFFKWAKNIFVYERDLGWTSNLIDEAIANGYDDPYIFAVKVFPTNVKFIYNERFFIIEKEDYLDQGTPWMLLEYLNYNGNWDGEYLIEKCPFAFYEKVSILGEWKTFEEFDREAQIEGVPIKEVLKKSFIYDAM